MSEMTYEETLAHFGVRGMKWGVRKGTASSGESTKSGMSKKKKVAIGAGAILAIAGAAAAVHILGQRGSTSLPSVKSFNSSHDMSKSMDAMLRQNVWKAQVKSLSDDIQAATKAQDINLRRSVNALPGTRIVDADMRKHFGLPALLEIER